MEYIKEIISRISEKGRKYKLTNKKKYLKDGLITPSGQRIASIYIVLIVTSPAMFLAGTSSFENAKN